MKKTALFVGLVAASVVAQQAGLFPILKSAAAIGRQAGGFYLLPTNQLLRPWGEQSLIPGRPVDLAFDSGQRIMAILNWRGVMLVQASAGVPYAEIPSRSTSYAGVAFRPGDREIWASEATRNGPDGLLVTQLDELGRPGKSDRIALAGHPVPAAIAFSSSGAKAYVVSAKRKLSRAIERWKAREERIRP